MSPPADVRPSQGRALARLRRSLALGGIAALLAVGAGSGAVEVAHGFLVPDADGRGFVARWRHVADPPAERLERAYGSAWSPIVAALLASPPQDCWVRPRIVISDPHVTLVDLELARSLHQGFYPSRFDPLPIGVVPAAADGRLVLDLDVADPLALPAGFERVAANRRFVLWRPKEPPK